MHDTKQLSKKSSTKNTARARPGLTRHKTDSKDVRISSGSGLRRYLTAFKQQPDEDSKNRSLVFGWLLAGTLVVAVVVWLLLLLSYAVIGNNYVISRFIGCTFAVGFLVAIGLLAYTAKQYKLAAWLLIGTYAVIAWSILWQWGINTPFGILLFCLVIVLSGILVRAQYALYAAGVTFAVLVFTQLALTNGWHIPNDDWTGKASNFGDVFAYSIGFMMIAIVSWLYGRQMERSLNKATTAERALQAQKANLERIVQQRTADLEQTQIEEMEQMYRLTQVGSLSTGLLHDLANYLTVLTLDIENLRNSQDKHDATTLERAQQTISYIDTMVEDVRSQLHGEPVKEPMFNTVDALNDVIGVLRGKAAQSSVQLDWKAPKATKQFDIVGDKTRFNQVLTTLICNAIDAYTGDDKNARVIIQVERTEFMVTVSVRDYGKGIPDSVRSELFKKLQSSKMSGMGIGLFLAKQIVERHLRGSLTLDPSRQQTHFIIQIPAVDHDTK